jgi:cell division protein FtsZ
MKPMAISLSAPRATELKPRIVVFGVGGAGSNAVNNMIDADLQGVEFVVANTDAQQLQFAKTDRRIQLGVTITQGLGAGAHPEIGTSAAEESIPEIHEHLEGAHMVFITAGMGGGTGTGAAPIIARAARERGILTVGVVTKPFHFEGRHRMRLADQGVAELQRVVDTLIVIPNQNLFRIANERTTFAEAFGMADQVLHSGVRSITDLMVLPGLINLDFADVRTVMTEMGKAMMGTGEATGEDRALMAARNAIQNPLLDEVSLKGAKAVLVNVTGGLDMTLLEVDEAANAISSEVDPEANIIFGAAFDPELEGRIRVSVVATGMDAAAMRAVDPVQPRTTVAPPTGGRTAGPAPLIARTAEPVRESARVAEPVRSEPVARVVEPARAPVISPAATTAPPPTYSPAADAYAQRAEAPTYGASHVAAEEPRVVETAAMRRDATPRVVDPLAAEDGDEPFLAPPVEQPLIHTVTGRSYTRPGAPPLPDPRAPEPRKSGWLSLFGGRQRYEDVPAPAAPQPRASAGVSTASSGANALKMQPSPEVDEPADDLEIPSFLRRLAN